MPCFSLKLARERGIWATRLGAMFCELLRACVLAGAVNDGVVCLEGKEIRLLGADD